MIFAGDNELPEGMVHYEAILASADPVEDAGRGNDDLAGIFYTGAPQAFQKA